MFSFDKKINMIKAKLNAHPLLLNLPVGESHMFAGAVDLIKMEVITYGDAMGNEIRRVPVKSRM